MRWLVTGATGMLGADVVRTLRLRDEHVLACSRTDLDVTDARSVRHAVRDVDVVVNCAAWTAVDDAEEDEGSAFEVNAGGVQHLAIAAEAAGARLVHISTDYVFDGEAAHPYPEDAVLAPRSAYGRTKAAGEWVVRALSSDHLIVRTAWLYGAHGSCFPRTIARIATDDVHPRVVIDQVGQPTWSVDVADLIIRLVRAHVPAGTYHATAGGWASWHDFAREIVLAIGGSPELVRPATSAEYPRRAPRPGYSALAHSALLREGIDPIADWRERWRVAAHEVLDL